MRVLAAMSGGVDSAVAAARAVAAGHDRLPLCDPVGRLEVVAARVLRGLAHEGALERHGPFLGVVLAEVA